LLNAAAKSAISPSFQPRTCLERLAGISSRSLESTVLRLLRVPGHAAWVQRELATETVERAKDKQNSRTPPLEVVPLRQLGMLGMTVEAATSPLHSPRYHGACCSKLGIPRQRLGHRSHPCTLHTAGPPLLLLGAVVAQSPAQNRHPRPHQLEVALHPMPGRLRHDPLHPSMIEQPQALGGSWLGCTSTSCCIVPGFQPRPVPSEHTCRAAVTSSASRFPSWQPQLQTREHLLLSAGDSRSSPDNGVASLSMPLEMQALAGFDL